MNPAPIEWFAAFCLMAAVLHTFLVGPIRSYSKRFKPSTLFGTLLTLTSDVELIFGIWALILIIALLALVGPQITLDYLASKSFAEPLYVFAIIIASATQSILKLVDLIIHGIARLVPLSSSIALYISCLTIGPLLGSLISEPAAMTVTALLLDQHFFSKTESEKFKYLTLGVLFVNISIGGVLTPFAAPPVIMIAKKWGWDLSFTLSQFGIKVLITVIFNASVATLLQFNVLKSLSTMSYKSSQNAFEKQPFWISIIHIAFLSVLIIFHDQLPILISTIVLFLIFVRTTQKHQKKIKFFEAFGVAVFLVGLVILGGLQSWWLNPLIVQADTNTLYFGSALLTSFFDNAAITYLGGQLQNTSPSFQYAIVAGSVVGGGLTVIANAPNPIGYTLLQNRFKDGINPIKLALGALLSTLSALLIFWL